MSMALSVTVLLTGLSLVSPRAHAGTELTVTGIVQFHQGDEAGKTTQVCIDNGTIYIVVNAGRGMELLALEGQKVTATGEVNRNEESGEVRIEVGDFYVVEGN